MPDVIVVRTAIVKGTDIDGFDRSKSAPAPLNANVGYVDDRVAPDTAASPLTSSCGVERRL